MSSEPIERRISYVGDRLRVSQCSLCGKEYFGMRNFCSSCGRKSIGKMRAGELFFEEGTLEECLMIDEPTNKFKKLAPYYYGVISFRGIRIPGRLTDILNPDLDPSELEGRKVVPRFRERYEVGRRDIIPTFSLAFTFSDEYYPYQHYEEVNPSKFSEKPGVVGFAAYTSRFRIREGNVERSVPFLDENSITAAVEAGKLALIQSRIPNELITKVYVGSESNPYAVKPIASKVAQVLALGEEDKDSLTQGVDAIDTEFACKAATSMFKDAIALSKFEDRFTMVIGTDNSQAAPRYEKGGELDFFVGFGATAFIFGNKEVAAEIEGWYSVTSDTPDFWRRDGEKYPMHGGRFTGEPAYFKHIKKAASKLMEKLNLMPQDVNYFVPHQPNLPFPMKVARELGFKEEQLLPALQVGKFGNTYSSSSPLGLVAVLEKAKPNERILLVSYGSGAGSDAYSFLTTSKIEELKGRNRFTVELQATSPFKQFVDYPTYRKLKEGL